MAEEDKRFRAIKKKCWAAANEVKVINETGRAALTNSGQVFTFKGMFRSLEKYFTKFELIWEEMSDQFSEKFTFPSDDDEKKRQAVRGYYYEAQTNFEILTHREEEDKINSSIPAHSGAAAQNSTIVTNRIETSLQAIPIPTFSGQILEWPNFRDIFTSIVHDDETLSPIKKFHYLVRSLSGPASTIVSAFKIEANNYELAWQALKNNFENKRVLANCYLNKVLAFKPLQKSTPDSLKKFVNEISDNVAALKRLAIADEGDFILFHLAIRNLDSRTREQFEIAHKHVEFPKFDDLSRFVQERVQALQLADIPATSSQIKTYDDNKQNSKRGFSYRPNALVSHVDKPNYQSASTGNRCIVCNESPGHALKMCTKFRNAVVEQRLQWLKTWKGCQNCLSYHHKTSACNSKFHCRYCPVRHHSLLHSSEISDTNPGTSNRSPSDAVLNSVGITEPRVILGTALAEIADARGIYHHVRLVIDSGSQHSFITQRMLRRLGLLQSNFKSIISGIGDTLFSGAKGKVDCLLRSRSHDALPLKTSAVVVKDITTYLPNCSLPFHLYSRYMKFELADPEFWKASPVDFLLGAELFAEIWTGQVYHVDEGSPKLFSSVFGNVVIGQFSHTPTSHSTTSLLSTSDTSDLLDSLNRFWEIEEPSIPAPRNPDDDKCEKHFKDTHSRTPSGQYMVRLPFIQAPPPLETSIIMSKRMFFNLESKLSRNPQLQTEYGKFMQEYIDLGHMSRTTSPPAYVIPHHAVVKQEGTQMKLRVVFNASASTCNGSLNDFLLVGPKLQNCISTILLNFRIHKVAFVTDLVKMFRNVLMEPADRPFQHIYWRADPSQPLAMYALHTVSYGTRSAPYQALRVIQQLKEDEGLNFPLAANILTTDVYVDDYLTGSHSVASALELQAQLIGIMKKGGFSMSKWSSNCKVLLDCVTCASSDPISINPEEVEPKVKILGLQWEPVNDCFSYKINIPNPVYTKRGILSTVAKVYDPLGFLTPSVLLMKNFIQSIWKEGLHWDQHISVSMQTEWDHLIGELTHLSRIRIPRFVGATKGCRYQVVGFSDASTKGYCAVIYLRTIHAENTEVHLLTAKSKLAPVRTISIPRLELQGAYLLSITYKSIAPFLNRLSSEYFPPTFLTDSSIVLGWLNTPAYCLKTFVANRVSEICKITHAYNWRHIDSADNPSDIGSRGILPSQLVNHCLWWKGPHWLSLPQDQWPPPTFSLPDSLPECKTSSLVTTATMAEPFIIKWMQTFSSLSKLLTVMAVLVRRLKRGKNDICRGAPLHLKDIKNATITCIKAIQSYYFIQDAKDHSSKMKTLFGNLSPFMDTNGLWRVGGRLRYSNLTEDHKHPILLPTKSHFSIILVDHYHRLFLHASPTVVQAMIQTRYWIPALRRVVRKRTFMCIKCFKHNAKSTAPIMADLPAFRVQGKRAFGHVGVDFAGPFCMRESLRRKAQTSKVYLCLFVCMETKALHLEAVTQLTTKAFMAAMDRFIARRGLPSAIYSDSGTNFIGASNHLKNLYLWLQNSDTQNELHRFVLHKEIQWHFNPPQAPHFGGLWESGVRSVKRLMRVSAGETSLTYEELSTLFARYEAILNSRPLCPISPDPEDTDFLTPGHFLVGGNLLAYPEPSILDCRENLLNRWQLLKRISQQFWQKWHMEYLVTLQKRTKWTEAHPNLQVGDLVILKNPSLPVMQWPTSRVTHIHPGADGTVRVVSIKTASGQTFKRPTVQLIPLLPLSIPSFDN